MLHQRQLGMLVSAKTYTTSSVFLFLVKILFLVLLFPLNALILVCGIINLAIWDTKLLNKYIRTFLMLRCLIILFVMYVIFPNNINCLFNKVFPTLIIDLILYTMIYGVLCQHIMFMGIGIFLL